MKRCSGVVELVEIAHRLHDRLEIRSRIERVGGANDASGPSARAAGQLGLKLKRRCAETGRMNS